MQRQSAMILIAAAAVLGCARSIDADDSPTDTRDIVMMLDSGPVHLRVHVAMGDQSLSQARDDYLARLTKSLDIDDDGRVTQQERQESVLFSVNRTRASIDNPFLQNLRTEQVASRGDLENDLARVGAGTLFSYLQDNSAASNDLSVFELLDADDSGRIDPGEMQTAAPRVAALDEDRDECISFSEFNTEEEPVDSPFVVVGVPPDEDRPRPTASELLRELDRVQALRMMRRYDRNRDQRLTAAETGWDEERLKHLDSNGDGALDHNELLRLRDAPPDLELFVDLLGDGERAPLEVVSSNAARQAPSPRPDLVRLKFERTTVTFSFRRIDPLASALQSAMLVFNQVDQDGNGYIERSEIQDDDRHRWNRHLFDNMDRDGDEKVFADEATSYVTTVCEPAGYTCNVNLYDTGQGFFQMMDSNGDGRISIRELRTIDQSLRENANGPGETIIPGDSGRHYHVEFVRGSYQLFGEPERMVAQGTTFIERPAVGPVWFQRMDRNSDGDLTYISETSYGAEFLGPREAFHRLDADGDGLIDAKEAERADELWPNTFDDNANE